MPDPIIQVPNPVLDSGNASAIDQVMADIDASRESFFSQASDAFTERVQGAEGETQRSSPRAEAPLQPARQAASTSQAAPAKSAPPAVGTSAGKPGQPGSQSQSNPPRSDGSKVPGAPHAGVPSAPAQGNGEQGQQAAQQPAASQTPPASEDGDDVPRDYRPGSVRSEHWDKLHNSREKFRSQRNELRGQLEALQAKLQSAVPNDQLQQQLTALKQERDAYLQKLEQVAFERSPRFESMFKPRIDAAVSLAKSALGPEHASKIEQLLSMPDTEFRNVQLNQLAEGLSPLALGKLANAIGEVDRANSEKQALAAKGHETWRQWQQEEQQRQQAGFAASAEQMNAAFTSEFEAWKGFEMFKEKPGDAAHNAAVQQRVATARGILSGALDPQDLSRAAIWASLGPDLVGALTAERQRAAALEQELASLRVAQPGVAGDSGGAPSADDTIDASAGYAGGIAALVAREGLLR